MAALEHDTLDVDVHPIDIVETLAEQSSWNFDRLNENAIAMCLEGQWESYAISLAWTKHDDLLRILTSSQLKGRPLNVDTLHHLMRCINEGVWLGHLSYDSEDYRLIYRYGLSLVGGATANPEQIEQMVLNGVVQLERFYPAIQCVSFENYTVEAAMKLVFDEAYGTA